MKNIYKKLALKILISRYAQLIINEKIKSGIFNIPIHLALGHEVLSEAVCAVMQVNDKLLCSHRNIHYQFGRGATLSEILEEFKLSVGGLAKGLGGSMNLTNLNGSIIYTSSILGNNLCVGLGVALSKKIKKEDGVIFIVTGDGAMEEGAFYETIENARNMDLSIIILIENNNWSLASKINERRKPIDIHQLVTSLGARYTFLTGNKLLNYYNKILEVREKVSSEKLIAIVEVKLTTLGGWIMQNEDFPDGKYVNYHAGKAPKVSLTNGPILNFDVSDPLFLIKETLGEYEFQKMNTSARLFFSEYLN
jgi:TPP-dependent pyruvate/acetoin dehydrogenase alpha subunit